MDDARAGGSGRAEEERYHWSNGRGRKMLSYFMALEMWIGGVEEKACVQAQMRG